MRCGFSEGASAETSAVRNTLGTTARPSDQVTPLEYESSQLISTTLSEPESTSQVKRDRKMAEMQKAVKWYPPSYDIRVERVPIPRLIHPVMIQLCVIADVFSVLLK